ncbi:MAG: DUF1249 domain-containing protein [Steroidobacteraceae bacterium]
MLNDALSQVSWRARPRSFVALMSLYESNYIRLGWLAGDLRALRDTYRSRIEGDCDLLLTVIEQCAYTSIFDLTYELPEARGLTHCPDLRLRVYHDARLVEAAPAAPAADRPAEAATKVAACAERELRQRWVRNMMLNKWLEYCAERGHRFAGIAV